MTARNNSKFFHKYILTAWLLLTMSALTQGQSLILVTPIEPPMQETSGMIIVNGKLITHNDSGGAAALYQIDTITGNQSRTVEILGAQNVDWEDLCIDATTIYIADIGNNNGTRTDLKIYKVDLNEFADESNNEVSAELIAFEYSDQIDFTSAPFATNYDAEAIVSIGDSLYIFTKNWVNNWTNVYSLPKTTGTYTAEKVDSINIEGLATGAVYHLETNEIVLSGYVGFSNPFIVQIENFSEALFSQGDITKTNLTILDGYSQQIEGLAFLNGQQVYLTGEENFLGNAALYRLNLDETSNTTEAEKLSPFVYPNPTSSWLNVSYLNFEKFELYDSIGQQVLTSSKKRISIAHLAHGNYVAIIRSKDGTEIARTKIIIH